MALQYMIPDDNGKLTLAVSDVFNTVRYRLTTRGTDDLYFCPHSCAVRNGRCD